MTYGITNAGGGKSADLGTKTITANGTYSAATDGLDGYSEVTANVPSGDTITATNTTGSAVSAEDRVWVNGEDVYTRDFTGIYGSPVINDTTRILESKAGNYGYIYKELTGIAPQSSYEQVVKIKYDSYLANYTFHPLASYDSSIDINAYGIYIITGSSVLYWFVPGRSLGLEASPSLSSLTVGNFYWFKISITTEGAVASYSTDGITYTNITTVSDTTLISNSVYSNSSNKYFILGGRGNVITIDLGGCYIKVDGQTVWTPYTKTSTNYSIINDTDITSTSFTGIAQEAIANNATGSIKTLLDGNGTYAPTTATKSITTNGTYTASAENAYGLSEVTVNVPTPDVWHNWKNTEYTSNFSTTGTVSVNDRVATNTYGNIGYIYTSKTFSQPTEKISCTVRLKYFSNYNNSEIPLCGFYSTSSSNLGAAALCLSSGSTVFRWTIPGLAYTITASPNFSQLTSGDYLYMKAEVTETGVITYYSLNGEDWTTSQSVTQSGLLTNFAYSNQYLILGSTNGWNYEIDLSKINLSVDNSIVWTPYTENSSQCYTLTSSPTTSTQVYEIPKKTSALTITAVGTGTITLSDSKVYNRNSAGDVESPVLGTKTITSNDTYTAASDYLDGFSSVTVDVPSAPTKKYNLLDRVKDDNNNEIGTVSGFFTDANNVEYAVVCLDAQYRANGLAWSSNTSTAVTNLPLYYNTTWGPWEAKETATFNTQKISDFAYSGACSHCRSKSFTIDGTTYYGQLPNLAELSDIMRNRSSIYSLDVTTSTTSSSINLENSENFWSSTQYYSTEAWYMTTSGKCDSRSKSAGNVVIPVLEIPNT